MILNSCRAATWSIDAFSSEGRRRVAALRVLLSFGLMYEIALALKIGARPSQVRVCEDGVLYLLHEELSRIPDFSLRYEAYDGCQVCSLMNAVRGVARSSYSHGATAFVLSTRAGGRTNWTHRVNYDWAEVFHEFLRNADLSRDPRGMRRMTRAQTVCMILREVVGWNVSAEEVEKARQESKELYQPSMVDKLLFSEETQLPTELNSGARHNRQAAPFSDDAEMDRFAELERQIDVMFSKHLKILR